MKPLAVGLSEPVRELIRALMEGQAAGSLPALFFASGSRTYDSLGNLVREEPPHWHLNVYSPAQVENISRDYAALGQALVHDVQGVALCIPQPHLVAELIGKTLDAQGRSVSVR